MTDEIRVKLTIASDTLSAKQISGLLGIEADSFQVLGEMNKLGTKPYPQHVWRIKDRREIDRKDIIDQMEACVSQFLDRVGQVSSTINSLSAEHLVEVGIYVLAREVPPISLTKKQIEAIAALGASVDVDIVLYADNESPE